MTLLSKLVTGTTLRHSGAPIASAYSDDVAPSDGFEVNAVPNEPGMTSRTRTMIEAFRRCAVTHGFSEYQAGAIASGIDTSVRFIGSSISTMKPLIINGTIPVTGAFIVQPALRTHCLRGLTDPTSRYHWSSYFVQLGLLARGEYLPLMASTAMDLFLGYLQVDAHRLLIRGSSLDNDLVAMAGSQSLVRIEVDGYAQKMYRHRFGLDEFTGRNINYAIEVGGVFRDVGNLIVIERNGVAVGIELAIGVSVVLGCLGSLAHPVMASPIADHLRLETWDEIKCGNALEASIVLTREGLRPVARGRGRTFRDYLRALYLLASRVGIPIDQIYEIAMVCDLPVAVEVESRERSAGALRAHLSVQSAAGDGSSPAVHEAALSAFDAALTASRT